jgi:hypothetical protein
MKKTGSAGTSLPDSNADKDARAATILVLLYCEAFPSATGGTQMTQSWRLATVRRWRAETSCGRTDDKM